MPSTPTHSGDPVVVVGTSWLLPTSDAGDPWTDLMERRTQFSRPETERRPSAAADFRPDGAAFGTSDVEVAESDPQQFLALELAVLALDDAGIDVRHLPPSTAVGVVIGAMGHDFVAHDSRLSATPYTLTGTSTSFIANRMSQQLGLDGPSMVVDCGQSSSLVAIHEAAGKLALGHCDVVIAGGVQLNGASSSHDATEAAGVLSPRSNPTVMSTDSDGYLRGEGGAMLIMCTESFARQLRLQVKAVVAGSATNTGRQRPSLTSPDSTAQQKVIEQAMAAASVSIDDIDYVELHGTGTPVGDAAEADALYSVFDGRRNPLPIGSSKQLIGHLEGASGAVSAVKAIRILAERTAPGSVIGRETIPSITSDGPLSISPTPTPLPANGPLAVGVSAFGLGGMNCHAIFRSAPQTNPPTRRQVMSTPAMWTVSAPTEKHLRHQAGVLAAYLDNDPDPSAANTLAHGRGFGAYRLVTDPVAPAQAAEILHKYSSTNTHTAVTAGSVTDGLSVCMFPGQGSQRVGMGYALAQSDRVFDRFLRTIAAAIDRHLDRPLLDVMWGSGDDIHDTRYTQPALFAFELALFWRLRSKGYLPDIIIGHSVGELTGLCASGCIDLDTAAKLVVSRAAYMADLSRDGAMLAVKAPATALADHIADLSADVRLAAVNSPHATVVSGRLAAIAEIEQRCRAAKLKSQRLQVSHAFHSPLIDPAAEHMAALQVSVHATQGSIMVASTVRRGQLLDVTDNSLPAGYLVDNAAGTVWFRDAVDAAVALGATSFLEVGTGKALTTSAAHTAPTTARLHATSPSSKTEAAAVERACATLYTWGQSPRLVAGPRRHPRNSVPLTAFRPPVPSPLPDAGDTHCTTRTNLAAVTAIVRELGGRAAPQNVDLEQASFSDLGIDSRSALVLAERLSRDIGHRVPNTAVYEYPNPAALAAWLDTLDARVADTPRPARRRIDRDRIAIVAASCRLPGGIGSPDDLWGTLASNECLLSEFPRDRGWDLAALYDSSDDAPGTYLHRGGFIDGIDRFDPTFFDISVREARAMDPQQRLLLTLSWRLAEQLPQQRFSTATGVFVGATTSEYGQRLYESSDSSHQGYRLTGATPSVISGRLAYQYGLRGPAVTVDTACSSSLVALHYACQALRAGECDTAIAGGVALMPTPGMFVEFSAQNGLSTDGFCRPYSEQATGTVWSEGAGLLLLETEEVAKQRGHAVLGYIAGSAVSQDGRSNGLTAPNGHAQQEVLQAALDAARIRPHEVDIIEGHGTGTRLGDPIEIRALHEVYGSHRARPILLGSVKSNIGHTQAAAGVTGIIKMLQSLKKKTVPATLFADQLTSLIDWETTQLTVPNRNVNWDVGDYGRRVAGVSAFGISGTNCHMIVVEGTAA